MKFASLIMMNETFNNPEDVKQHYTKHVLDKNGNPHPEALQQYNFSREDYTVDYYKYMDIDEYRQMAYDMRKEVYQNYNRVGEIDKDDVISGKLTPDVILDMWSVFCEKPNVYLKIRTFFNASGRIYIYEFRKNQNNNTTINLHTNDAIDVLILSDYMIPVAIYPETAASVYDKFIEPLL